MTISKVLRDIFARFRNLILYGIIGSLASLLDFLMFSCLTLWTHTHYLAANAISCTIGILCSFLLNRKYNFKVMDHVVRRMVSFFSVGVVGLILSSVALHVFIERLRMGETVSKGVSIVVVALIQFCLNKYVSFRQDKPTFNSLQNKNQ